MLIIVYLCLIAGLIAGLGCFVAAAVEAHHRAMEWVMVGAIILLITTLIALFQHHAMNMPDYPEPTTVEQTNGNW